ncbi:nephrin-like isoform X2 [Planococcus citri]|uniref:nephrin-like isoform X2 n=1 Tax=Planococcus citri TaxID=170843 RepID=UPI0031F9A237
MAEKGFKNALSFLYIFIPMLLLSKSVVSVKQQSFRVEPRNTRVQEGSEITLECEINNRGGEVQWTKDGFGLGTGESLVGFPRYMMVGDKDNGVYNLRIRNVSLDDDAEFQCQVGPLRNPTHAPIRRIANLTVLSPPASIEMVGYRPNSTVEIHQNQELVLECLVKKSKPAAKIVWYRNSNELKLENRVDKVMESKESHSKAKLYDVSSRIRLTPTAEDDYINYTCEAQHEALPLDMALKVTVQLSVMYPPEPPYIESFPKGDKFNRGEKIELICKSRGGNPPAQLVWYKNGEQVRDTAEYRQNGRMSENVYVFTAEMDDNKAKYTCEASSVVGPTHMKTELNLTVHYAPTQVTILGPTEAKVGDLVHLNCTTGVSNPAASIKWTIDGRQVHNTTYKSEAEPHIGWISSSVISIPITPDRSNIIVICHAVNSYVEENVVNTHTINVLYPPEAPIISGYTPGEYIESGTVKTLKCKSTGGNPLASLMWYKNDKKIDKVPVKSDKSTVYSEYSIFVNATDNEAIYKCEASNLATDIPLFKIVKLNVYFPPDTVKIKKEPKVLRAGSAAKLICDASSSNPEADLTWWRDGIPVTEGISKMSKPGLHGGNVTTSELSLSITPDMDRSEYICQAENTVMKRKIHADDVLSVLYKPIFNDLNETSFINVEGDDLVIMLQANAQPSAISYTWTRNGERVSKFDGPVLNFTRVDRKDSGFYTCEASNSEGSATMNFTITVQYPASVSGISNEVLVDEGEHAELWCTVDALPLISDHISWRRPGFPLGERSAVVYKNNTSYLTVHDVTKKDMGPFYCVADNGLGNETSQPALLIVKHKPEFDQSPVLQRAASRPNETGRLICRASGAPKLTFSWSKDMASPIANNTNKYSVHFNKLDAITYESILSIRNVEPKDYGFYQCSAHNSKGSKTTKINFTTPTHPDPPLSMNVVNTTHDTITIAWTPGFDGGEPARYKIRYAESHSTTLNYRYSEVDSNTVQTITGLQLGTPYIISVLAYNSYGKSDYAKGVKVVTSNVPAEALLVNAEFPLMFIFCIAATAALLLLINICILTAFFYRRKKFQGNNEQNSNKSGTIEMYAPSSYNETMTGETLSSVSEKSETYSDSRQDYDEKRKNCGNTYMIEPIDYPFQYPGYDTHPKDTSIGRHRNPYISHNGTGYQSENSSRYSSTADPRYVTYPPPVQFAQPTLPSNGTLRCGAVPPPDVTVLTAPPPISMSTFNYDSSETEGHLV